ncbi:MAG: hypothetical protein NTX72_01170 [Candidatus Uhrbacteria bacterium]|nr:hypothetical protein [Candidatus Uhrbacteria bacterium]
MGSYIEVNMFDLFDRCLIAGIVLAVGGLVFLRKRERSEEIAEQNAEPVIEVDHRPSATIIEFPMHRRPMYDSLPGFGWEEAEVIDLAEWKLLRLQRMWALQNSREAIL